MFHCLTVYVEFSGDIDYFESNNVNPVLLVPPYEISPSKFKLSPGERILSPILR